jgi:hypothetical protein
VFFGTAKIARNIVFQALEDSTDLDTDIRQDAINWMATPDFQEACKEASLDYLQIKNFMIQIMKLPNGIRRKKIKDLLGKYS